MEVRITPTFAPPARFELTTNSLEESGLLWTICPMERILPICPTFLLKTGLFFQYFHSVQGVPLCQPYYCPTFSVLVSTLSTSSIEKISQYFQASTSRWLGLDFEVRLRRCTYIFHGFRLSNPSAFHIHQSHCRYAIDRARFRYNKSRSGCRSFCEL